MQTKETFDTTKAYAEQEEVYFDDGREAELLQYVLSREDIDDIRGVPQKVLSAIDDFGTKKYLMNVGESKGKIVTKLIAATKPKVMVELGAYVGYSAILFADAVKAAGGEQYFCLEHNPEFAAITEALVDLAGLSDIVSIMVGDSHESIRRLKTENRVSHIDLLFLDHIKSFYLPDLKLCEELGFIRKNTVLAADNVIKPGNPPYLEYVRSSVSQKKQPASTLHSSDDGFKDWQSVNVKKLRTEVKGNPNLIYESNMIESFEPTGILDGIEITRCKGLVESDDA